MAASYWNSAAFLCCASLSAPPDRGWVTLRLTPQPFRPHCHDTAVSGVVPAETWPRRRNRWGLLFCAEELSQIVTLFDGRLLFGVGSPTDPRQRPAVGFPVGPGVSENCRLPFTVGPTALPMPCGDRTARLVDEGKAAGCVPLAALLSGLPALRNKIRSPVANSLPTRGVYRLKHSADGYRASAVTRKPLPVAVVRRGTRFSRSNEVMNRV